MHTLTPYHHTTYKITSVCNTQTTVEMHLLLNTRKKIDYNLWCLFCTISSSFISTIFFATSTFILLLFPFHSICWLSLCFAFHTQPYKSPIIEFKQSRLQMPYYIPSCVRSTVLRSFPLAVCPYRFDATQLSISIRLWFGFLRAYLSINTNNNCCLCNIYNKITKS